jgi:flagellar hook-associated protein 1 FlgK
MADLLRIGLSALLSHQQGLATTSNNIANANTAGYARQRIELGELPVERSGSNFIGTGVQVQTVRRLTDDILAGQVRSAGSEFRRSEIFAGLASVLDNLLADQQSGLNASLQNFSNAMQQVADDPASQSARQVFLSEARNLAARFGDLNGRLDEIASELNSRIFSSTSEINSLGASIADVNRQILTAGVAPGGSPPADLLDQRDRLLGELSELVEVNAVGQSDGTVSVFIGSGQALVLGTSSSRLVASPGEFERGRLEIVLQGAGPDVNVTPFLSGGVLGGALDFRRELLDSTRADLGLIATGLAETFNTAHNNGMDLNGALGGDLFSVPPPQTAVAGFNTGTGTASATISDLSSAQATDYTLVFDGAAYTLLRNDTGAAVPMSGTGTGGDPFVADGLSIVVGGAPAAGDQFELRTVSHVTGGMSVLIDNPALIAAAAPTRTRTGLTNTGSGSVSAGRIVDVNDPALLAGATIEFIDAANYSVNGAGSFAYTPGSDIVVDGTAIQINGAPAAGDQFFIEANTGGIGDNRNALESIAALTAGLFAGGTTTLQGAASNLVTTVGAATAESANRRDAQGLLRDQSMLKLESVRGVNLDEEAANLLRLQQLYQAAAQTIAVADSLFQTLLGAVRR